jgi:hypothetical protein
MQQRLNSLYLYSILDVLKVKAKVKFSLWLINLAPCHEVIRGSGGVAPPFLTLALDGNEWSASRLGRFNARGRVPGTYRIGRWVGPSAYLDFMEKTKL